MFFQSRDQSHELVYKKMRGFTNFMGPLTSWVFYLPKTHEVSRLGLVLNVLSHRVINVVRRTNIYFSPVLKSLLQCTFQRNSMHLYQHASSLAPEVPIFASPQAP